MNDAESNNPERVCLGLRVSEDVKEAYESCIAEKHGRKSPYAGTVLERELRQRLGKGDLAELYGQIDDLADAFGKEHREKKILNTPDDDTAVVNYRVIESVRNEVLALASDLNYTTPGSLIETVMHSYAIGESATERMIDLAERIKNATEHKFDDGLSAKERRTKAIADELGDEFTFAEFREAIETGTKISDSHHTRTTYLPRVLDEKGCTWHPNASGLFIDDADARPEDRRDPRGKPYLLMDDADKRTALKYEAYTTDGRIEVSDAVSVLDGKAQRTTAKQTLREIGETDGFNYRPGRERKKSNADGVLRITDADAVETSPDHERLRKALPDETDDPEADGTTDVTTTGEVDDAEADTDDGIAEADDRDEAQDSGETDTPLTPTEADAVIAQLPDAPTNLPDPVVANKIAEATNENIDYVDGDELPTDLVDAVTDDEIAYVRDYAANGGEEPGTGGDNPGGSADETTIQRPDMDAPRDMDEITSGTPVRADGGTPEAGGSR